MKRCSFWVFLFTNILFTSVLAEVPYITRNGIEEVDYEKLNPLPGFKLPDSGQFRDTTYVHGEDADYSRNPMSFTISDDGEVVIDKIWQEITPVIVSTYTTGSLVTTAWITHHVPIYESQVPGAVMMVGRAVA